MWCHTLCDVYYTAFQGWYTEPCPMSGSLENSSWFLFNSFQKPSDLVWWRLSLARPQPLHLFLLFTTSPLPSGKLSCLYLTHGLCKEVQDDFCAQLTWEEKKRVSKVKHSSQVRNLRRREPPPLFSLWTVISAGGMEVQAKAMIAMPTNDCPEESPLFLSQSQLQLDFPPWAVGQALSLFFA